MIGGLCTRRKEIQSILIGFVKNRENVCFRSSQGEGRIRDNLMRGMTSLLLLFFSTRAQIYCNINLLDQPYLGINPNPNTTWELFPILTLPGN